MCVPCEKPPTMATAITLQLKFNCWSLAWPFGTAIEHLLPSVPSSLVGLSQNHKEIQNKEIVLKYTSGSFPFSVILRLHCIQILYE